MQRKELAQKTKDFRKSDDATKLAEIKGLLKGAFSPGQRPLAFKNRTDGLTLGGYSIPNLYRSPDEPFQIGELGISQGVYFAV